MGARHGDRTRSKLIAWLLTACILTGCAGSATRGTSAGNGAEYPVDPRDIPEDLLLDVGIAVFDVPDTDLDVDDDGGVFRRDEVLRAERNYVPHVIGKHLQAMAAWGAVRVVTRPSDAVDVTVTGVIDHSDGETLVFRARAIDARGVEWFDNEYRAEAEPGAYDADGHGEDPFADAYAALAADMADGLRALSLDDLARIRAVAELAFARSLAPEAFARHVSPNPEGGLELRRLPADDDPTLGRVREIRHREHLFIDQVNDHYDDFTANIREPYDQWRREAFRSRRAQRELAVKADAQVLLGSARIVAGLSRIDHDMPAHLGFDWISRGLGLIRGAAQIEGRLRDNAESMREVGSSTEANLLPHTIALENRTASLQQGIDSRYDNLRRILDRLYREEFGSAPDSWQESSSVEEQPAEHPVAVAETDDRPLPTVDPVPPTDERPSRGTRVESRTSAAKEQIRVGNVDRAIRMLDRILNEGEDVGTAASARIYTLLALGHFAQSDNRRALSAFHRVVNTACATICTPGAVGSPNSDRRRHYNSIRPAMHRFMGAVQDEILHGDYDYAIDMVTDLVGDIRGERPRGINVDAARGLGIFSLRPAERAATYRLLARAYVGKQDFAAAIEVYEAILGMGTRAPPLDRDISNESLAMIHFFQKDYGRSLKYQRDWLGASKWVGEACPKVCPSAAQRQVGHLASPKSSTH